MPVFSNCALEDDWTAASRRFGPIYYFPKPKSSYRSRNGDWRQTGSGRPRAISALRKANKKEHPNLRWEDALLGPVSVGVWGVLEQKVTGQDFSAWAPTLTPNGKSGG